MTIMAFAVRTTDPPIKLVTEWSSYNEALNSLRALRKEDPDGSYQLIDKPTWDLKNYK